MNNRLQSDPTLSDLLGTPLLSDEEAREAMKRFFAGTTSVVDELQLYAYFATGSVAPELQPYTEMMEWLAAGGQTEANRIDALQRPRQSFARRMFRWSGVAAVALLTAVAAWCVVSEGNSLRATEEEYAGSYAIIDGKRVTDLRVVLASMEYARRSAEQLVAEQLKGYDLATEHGDTIMASILSEIKNDYLK